MPKESLLAKDTQLYRQQTHSLFKLVDINLNQLRHFNTAAGLFVVERLAHKLLK